MICNNSGRAVVINSTPMGFTRLREGDFDDNHFMILDSRIGYDTCLPHPGLGRSTLANFPALKLIQ
jgi:hypothetical protein